MFSQPISKESSKMIEENKKIIFLKKGQQIIFEGMPAYGIYFLMEGKVKIFKSGFNDRQQIVRLVRPGDMFGHRGFGGKSVYYIGATTLEDSKVCFIDADVFFKVLKQEPELAIQIIHFYAEELKITERRLVNLTQMSAKEKIANAITIIYDTYHFIEGKTIYPLSRQDIADMSGTNIVQVSRAIKELEDEGYIKVSGKNIEIINLLGLKEMTKPNLLFY
jgi:CRP-like cAMP-binding protein